MTSEDTLSEWRKAYDSLDDPEPKSLALVGRAEQMLAAAQNLDDIRNVRDLAEAARHYAKQAKLGLLAQNHAAAISIEAQAKADAILRAGRETGEIARSGERRQVSQPVTPARLSDLDIDRMEAVRWAKVAAVPEEVRHAYVKEATERGEEVSRAGLLRAVAESGRQANLDRAQYRVDLPEGKFRILLADPPWQYDFVPTSSRAIENQYGTLDVGEIAAYRDDTGRHVSDLAMDDSVCFMWATAPKLQEALTVLDGWGFDYVTNLVWVKDKIGMGYWARSQHELVLIGKRGQFSPPPEAQRRSSVFDGRRGEHSVKPSLHEWIEEAFPGGGYVELFARSARPGWVVFGNQAPEAA